MDFYEVLDDVLELLRQRGRVTYRALKVQFQLDDEQLEALREELEYAHESSIQVDNRGLKWEGDTDSAVEPTPTPVPPTQETIRVPVTESEREPLSYTPPHLAEKILQSKSALEGERKQVTVLFCDLANSTPLAEKIGPEAMHTLLNRFFELALGEVHRYEGTINQFLGDGFMSLFGAPISHEDHARRAVLTALGMQQSLKEAALGSPYGVECQFRIGINSGLVVVGSIGDNLRMDYSAIGDTTNMAARLQTAADPGTILVSDSTSRLVEDYIRLETLEPVEVKGKTEPVPVFKVVGTLPRRSPIVSRSERRLSQFVGRERELATLEELFAQVEAGNGQVLGIVAEAGQGKSRLLYEFRQRLEGKPITYLEGRCLSYGGPIPYHPIIDVVRHNCGVLETDNPARILGKIGAALQEVGMEPDDSAPYLLQLLGVKEGTESIAQLTPEAIRTRTFNTLREMSLKGSQQCPIVFEVEDCHWCDHTSEAYLSELVESVPSVPILLLTTYRPGYRPPWIEKSYATQISLHSLAPQDAMNIVHSTRQDETLPDEVAQTIIAKAEGNPFFLEELTRTVIGHRDFQTDLTVPDTIQGVLSARIDRLPETHKRLLQTASVLGREFSLRLLERIWDGAESLTEFLDDLKRQEFLFERMGTEEPSYVFRHALTENVAYDSLLTTRRHTLNAAAGQALEALYADRLEDAYDRLAYHYANTENATKAVEYLTLVAEKAVQGYAHAEAVTSLQEALNHADRLPSEERDYGVLNVATLQAESLFYLGRQQETVDLLVREQEHLKQLPDPSLAASYYQRLGRAYSYLGQRELATQQHQRALAEAQKSHDTLVMGRTYIYVSMENIFAGRLPQAVEHLQQAVVLLEKTANPTRSLGMAYSYLAASYFFMGDFRRALEIAMKSATIGETIEDRYVQAQATGCAGLIAAARGEGQDGIETCERALQLSPYANPTAIVLGWLGYAYFENGDLAKALPTLEQAVEEATKYRSRQVQNWFKTYLSEAYLADGQLEKAYDFACQALALAQDIQHPWGVALAHRTLGRIAHTSGNFSEAETHLHEAREISDAIQSRYDLARTHLDLAALAHTQSNQDTVTTHLSTAYAWFQKLQVPKWIEKTELLAQEYGVTLTEVEIDDFETEGEV